MESDASEKAGPSRTKFNRIHVGLNFGKLKHPNEIYYEQQEEKRFRKFLRNQACEQEILRSRPKLAPADTGDFVPEEGAVYISTHGLYREYVSLANTLYDFMYGRYSKYYNAMSSAVIVLAVTLSCMDTYAVHSSDLFIAIIRCIFWFEIVLKVVAESNRPLLFWTGSRRFWNWFDFSLCVLLVVFPSASYLRALRFVKPLWHLDVLEPLLAGIRNIFSDVFCVVLILTLVMFMYAVIAVAMLSENDPMNFHNLLAAMTTLFKIATNEGWEEVFIVSYRGCDMVDYSSSPFPCAEPQAKPVVAVCFFFTFAIFSLILVLVLVTVISSSVTMVTKAINLEAASAQQMQSAAKSLWVSRLYWKVQDRSVVYAAMQTKCALVLLNIFDPGRGSAGQGRCFRVCAAPRSRLSHEHLPLFATDSSGGLFLRAS